MAYVLSRHVLVAAKHLMVFGAAGLVLLIVTASASAGGSEVADVYLATFSAKAVLSAATEVHSITSVVPNAVTQRNHASNHARTTWTDSWQ